MAASRKSPARKSRKLKADEVAILREGIQKLIEEVDQNIEGIIQSLREKGLSSEILDSAQMGMRSRRAHHYDVLKLLERAEEVRVTWQKETENKEG